MGAINGKRSCQKDIYVKYAPLLMTICRRYSISGLEPKDLLQEAFIEIFRSLEKYNSDLGAFKNWIITITIRTSIKASRKFNSRISIVDQVIDLEDCQETPLDKMSADELIDVINKIPDDYRILFNLSVIDGYAHKEIADLLNIKESTSRSKLKRARDMISNLMTPEVKKIKVV